MEGKLDKIPSWLRWALAPRVSIITFVIVAIVSAMAARIFVFISGERGWSINFFEYLLVPGFAAYCAVTITAILAPKGISPCLTAQGSVF